MCVKRCVHKINILIGHLSMIKAVYLLASHTPLLHIYVPVQVSLAEHLHSPAPELPEVSQYSPVKGSEHEASERVHLQTLFAASQYAPVVFPKQDEDVPHLHDPPTQISPVTLHVTP